MAHPDRVELMLRAMPGTLNQIAQRTGRPKTTVKHWVMELRLMGWAHVAKWVRSDGPGRMQPVIKGGPGRNAPCNLEVTTKADCERHSRARAKADGRHDFQLAKRRASDYARRVRQRGVKAGPFDALMK